MTAPLRPPGESQQPGTTQSLRTAGFPHRVRAIPRPTQPVRCTRSSRPGILAGGQPGGLGIRWGARIIDGILVSIVAWVLAAVFGASSNIMVTGLFSGVLMFGYFVAMEVSQGRTLGKMLLGLSVHGPGGA